MIKRIICLFIKSWNPFSIMPAWPSLESYKVHQKKSFTKSLQLRRWYRKIGMSYKMFKNKSPQCLFKLTTEKTSSHVTRNADNIPLLNTKHNFYRHFFLPSSIIEWNNLDLNLRTSKNFGIFKNNVRKFIRPKLNSFFNFCNLNSFMTETVII